MATQLHSWLEEQQILWIIVREDGSAFLATPHGLPPERFLLPGGHAPRALVQCLQVGRQAVRDAALRLRGLLVSIPRSLVAFQETEQVLRRDGALPLDQEQERALHELGMDVPFGEWADPQWAALYLLTFESEPQLT